MKLVKYKIWNWLNTKYEIGEIQNIKLVSAKYEIG